MAIWEIFLLFVFAIANFDHREAKGLNFFFLPPIPQKTKQKKITNFSNWILIHLEARAEIRKHFCWGFLEEI